MTVDREVQGFVGEIVVVKDDRHAGLVTVITQAMVFDDKVAIAFGCNRSLIISLKSLRPLHISVDRIADHERITHTMDEIERIKEELESLTKSYNEVFRIFRFITADVNMQYLNSATIAAIYNIINKNMSSQKEETISSSYDPKLQDSQEFRGDNDGILRSSRNGHFLSTTDCLFNRMENTHES